MNNRPEPIKAALQFIDKHFPNCQGAILAGSVVRGEATATSDLDIVIFDESLASSYRESLIDFGWNIELFAHNLSSYRFFFESDCKEARPCMPRMVSEGKILKDTGVLLEIRKEAQDLLEQGPQEWSKETIDMKRYFITDVLDDLIGCQNRGEGIFIANKLSELLSEFILRTNRKWIGSSKWVVRSLVHHDKELADKFVEAFDTFYKTNDIEKIVNLTDTVLKPFGGRLFVGFSIGKKKEMHRRKHKNRPYASPNTGQYGRKQKNRPYASHPIFRHNILDSDKREKILKVVSKMTIRE